MLLLSAVIILALIGGLLYRLGGIGHPYNTKYRDFGVPLTALLLLFLLGITAPWWIWLLTFGIMFVSMTTYCKFNNQEDVYWYNWFLTGTLYGISVLPFAFSTGNWLGFTLRTIILAFSTMAWSEVIDEVNLEEGGRGFLFIVTLPLLLL